MGLRGLRQQKNWNPVYKRIVMSHTTSQTSVLFLQRCVVSGTDKKFEKPAVDLRQCRAPFATGMKFMLDKSAGECFL